jgi:hypothetical protein
MTFDPYTNRVPWELLTGEERRVFLRTDFKDIRYHHGGEWFSKKGDTTLNDHTIYRLAQPKIDYCFDLFDDKFKWAATDKDGTKCLFTHEPDISYKSWVVSGGDMVVLPEELKRFQPLPKGVDWKDSLRRRGE